MSALRLRAAPRSWRATVISAATALVVGAWTLLCAASLVDAAPVPVPALLALPLLMLAVLVLYPHALPRVAQAAVWWSVVVGGGLLATMVVSRIPYAALVVPGLALSAVACSRRPAAAMVAVFLLAGGYGTLTALTPLPVPETVDLLLAGLWLGALWGYLFGAAERPAWLWPGVVAVAGYLMLTAFEVLASPDPEAAVFSFRATGWYIAAFLLVAFAPWPEGAVLRIAKGIVATTCLVGLYAAIRYITGPSEAEQELALSRVSNPDFVQYIGSFTSNKELAAWCAQAIPFSLAVALIYRDRWRVIAIAACVLCGFALLAADTRLQIVAVLAGLVLVLLLHQFARGLAGLRLGTTAAATAALVVIAVGAFGLATGFSRESTDRVSGILAPTEESTFNERTETWTTVLDDIDERPFGQGLGTVGDIQQRFGRFASVASLDSAYLKVGLEQGLVVMVFFAIAVLALLYGLARRAVLTPRAEGAALGIGAAGTLVALLVLGVGGLFHHGLTSLAAWVIVGVGVRQFTWRGEDGVEGTRRSAPGSG